MCKEDDSAPTFATAPGGYSTCSDHWKEFSAATVKPPAKATQAALADSFAGVSSTCIEENHGVGGQRPSQSPVHSGFFTARAGMTIW